MDRFGKRERINNIRVHLATLSEQFLAIEKKLEETEHLEPEQILLNLKQIGRKLASLKALMSRLLDGVEELAIS